MVERIFNDLFLFYASYVYPIIRSICIKHHLRVLHTGKLNVASLFVSLFGANNCVVSKKSLALITINIITLQLLTYSIVNPASRTIGISR